MISLESHLPHRKTSRPSPQQEKGQLSPLLLCEHLKNTSFGLLKEEPQPLRPNKLLASPSRSMGPCGHGPVSRLIPAHLVLLHPTAEGSGVSLVTPPPPVAPRFSAVLKKLRAHWLMLLEHLVCASANSPLPSFTAEEAHWGAQPPSPGALIPSCSSLSPRNWALPTASSGEPGWLDSSNSDPHSQNADPWLRDPICALNSFSFFT